MGRNRSFVRRLRLGLGILVATSLLGLTAVLAAAQRVEHALARSEASLSLLDDLKELQIVLLKARAAEQEFLLEDLRAPGFFQTGASAALESHTSALNTLEQQLRSLEARPNASESNVASIRAAIEAYGRSFRELVDLYRERGSLYTGTFGEMRRALFDLETALESLDAGARMRLRIEVLGLTGNQDEYLRYLDNRPRYLVEERIAILREEIQALSPPEPEQWLAPLDRYERAWKRLVAIDERIGRSSGTGLRGELSAAEQAAVPRIQAAVDEARARFEQARRVVQGAAAFARQVSATVFALALAVGLFLAVSLSRQLRQSLAALLGAVEAYARGDRSARVGALPRRDEFARLGEAFDRMAETLAETTDELEEINASLELAVKGDTAGLIERIRQLVAQRKPHSA